MPRILRAVVSGAWRESRAVTSVLAVLHAVSGGLVSFGLLATADVVVELLAAGAGPESVVAALPALALVIASFGGVALLDSAVRALRGILLPRIELAARDRLYAAVSAVDLVAFDDADFAELVRRATAHGPSQLRHGANATGELVGSAVSGTAAVLTAGLLHPVLMPLVLLSTLPQGWASMRSAGVAYSSFLETTSLHRRLSVSGDLLISRRDAAELRAYGARDLVLGQFRLFGTALAREAAALEARKVAIELAGRSARGVGLGLSFVALGLLVHAGQIPLALASAAVLAMRTSSAATQEAVENANLIYEASFYLSLYDACLADARRRRTHGDVPAVGAPSEIRLNDVGFRYPGAAAPAIDGVSLTICRGEVVAIVGENGSGKSTLARLIAGLYLPTAGTVSWDGVATSRIARESLCAHVALVGQAPTQWPASAENNIRIGRIDADDADGSRLADAAERSGTDAVVRRLPGGYGSLLSRRFQHGVDLSGGEWQRLGVARGLYRDARVTIADEPTAALDAHAEDAVLRSLRALGDRVGQRGITIMITHRLANVRSADRIVVLGAGLVVECGTHDDLVARDGVYAGLYRTQAAAYADAARS